MASKGGGLEVKVTGGAGYSADAIKVFEGINGTLLLAAFAARAVSADPHLPQPDLLAVSDHRRRVRRARDPGDRLRADAAGRHGQRPVVVDPVDPRARRGHGLRAAARRALSRGAAPAHEPARGDGAGAEDRRPGDLRLRPDGHRRAAVPVAGEGQRHVGARADRRARHRGRDGRDAHAAAGAAAARRPPRVLAVHPALRSGPHEPRAGRRLAAPRRPHRAPPAQGVGRGRRAAARAVARHPELRRRPDDRQLVPRRRRGGAGPEAARRVVPERRQRPDGHHRARPAEDRGGPQRRRRHPRRRVRAPGRHDDATRSC